MSTFAASATPVRPEMAQLDRCFRQSIRMVSRIFSDLPQYPSETISADLKVHGNRGSGTVSYVRDEFVIYVTIITHSYSEDISIGSSIGKLFLPLYDRALPTANRVIVLQSRFLSCWQIKAMYQHK